MVVMDTEYIVMRLFYNVYYQERDVVMELIIIENKTMSQNVYLYFDESSKEGVIIDPGGNIDGIKSTIERNDVKIKAILLTHGHFDHIGAAAKLRENTGAPIYCHVAEKIMLEDAAINLSTMTSTHIKLTPDNLLEDMDTIEISESTLKAIHTPGHTLGGVCYYDEKNATLFTGDTLFRESVGRTDLPGGNHKQLIESIKERLLKLPAEVRVYPGHSAGSTIEHEREYNSFL